MYVFFPDILVCVVLLKASEGKCNEIKLYLFDWNVHVRARPHF